MYNYHTVFSRYLSGAPLLSSCPPGLTIHFISVFYDELSFLLPKDGEKEESSLQVEKTASKKVVRAKNAVLSESLALTHDLEAKHAFLSVDTSLHLLEPFLQILADAAFTDAVHRAVATHVLAPLCGDLRKKVGEELFEMASDIKMEAGARKRLMLLVEQLGEEDGEVGLPVKNQAESANLKASCAQLKRGCGVRTRNMRKTRQRDKR